MSDIHTNLTKIRMHYLKKKTYNNNKSKHNYDTIYAYLSFGVNPLFFEGGFRSDRTCQWLYRLWNRGMDKRQYLAHN